MIFPESIFLDAQQVLFPIPEIEIALIKHEDIGEGVIRATCTINGLSGKRLAQTIYGEMVGDMPVWSIEDRIVSTWFAQLLEAKYQSIVADKIIVIQ